jgi:cytochrome P450
MYIDPRLILDRDVVQNPYQFYDALRQHAPVWRVGDAPIYVVTSFEGLCEAARRIEDFSSELKVSLYKTEYGMLDALPANFGAPALAIADPPAHTLHKQIMFPRFVARKMELLEDELSAFTAAKLEGARRKGKFDFMEEIGGPVPIRAINRLIGFRNADEKVLLKTALESSEVTGGTMTLEELGALKVRVGEINAWLDETLEERDGTSTDDVLDAVKAAMLAGQFSKGEALITMITLLSAGGESTGALLGNAVRILAEKPGLVACLKADMGLLPSFIEEAARLESPFRSHLRSVPRETVLAGVKIPAGSTMMLMWGAANRDPEKFDEPEKIKLDRLREHVVFGRGIHQCVGNALARMEARIVLSLMLAYETFPSIAEGQSPEWEHNLQVRRHRVLPLTWG